MVVVYSGGKPVETLGEEYQTLLAKLAAYHGEVEFRTEDGRPFGTYTPPGVEPICPWEPDLTKEEIDRRVNEPGGTTLDEFWRRMGVK